MGFDSSVVIDDVRETLDERLADVLVRAKEARDAAFEAASLYARHLAEGGDPREYPDVPYVRQGYAPPLVDRTLGLVFVYRKWNEARGSTNPVVPIQNLHVWQVAEYLHAHIGEPVTFATLSDEWRVEFEGDRKTKKGSPDEIARAVRDAQTDSLIARKTKVGGKVAYVLREKREGEERVEHVWSFPEETPVAA